MLFKMIGYGRLHYQPARSQRLVEWPAVGVALQKDYISAYISISKEGAPLLKSYSDKLGALRAGHNHFSFKAYSDLDQGVLATLLREADQIFKSERVSPSSRSSS
jgi:hypothetical protein